MGKLDGKVAIVTGGGRGLGRGFAMALAKEGATIVIPEYNEEILTHTINELKDLGFKALGIVCNVRFRDQVDAAVATTLKEFGAVNILVDNAQQYWVGIPLEEQTEEKMRLTWESGFAGHSLFYAGLFPLYEGARR
jgi:NAD(P)-dependent dehydrogenase (short-subunit alcohol dehydrogenase family)